MAVEATDQVWMWQPTGEELQGVSLDRSTGLLHWYTGLGCTCGEDLHGVEQSIADYLAHGTPGFVSEPPADVKGELMGAVTNADAATL